MVLLGEEAQKKARLSLFGDSANLDSRLVHSMHGTYHMLEINLDTPDGTPR